ncbi:MAG: hypothetical protein P1P76_02140 [Anaerolineales bacterium]|nr:hypothetical protein [Anaerolineales bacterium]
MSAIFLLIKWRIFQLDQPRIFFDTTSYTLAADNPILSKSFWASSRPITIPLFYKLFGLIDEVYTIPEFAFVRFTYFQLFLSTISWVALGSALASALRARWIRPLAYLIVLFFAASLDVSQWDRMLLSESLSYSFMALFLACLIWYLSSWGAFEDWPLASRFLLSASFLLVTGLYSFTRDLNVFFVLIAALILIVWTIYRRSPDKITQFMRLCMAFLMLIIFSTQTFSASRGYRWFGPFRNVLYARLLESDHAVGFFMEAGLPLGSEKVKVIRELGREEFMDYLERPEAEPAFLWLRSEGRSVYLSYLLAAPLNTAAAPFSEFKHMVSPDSSEYRDIVHPTPAWLSIISRVMSPESAVVTLLFLLTPMMLLAGWSIKNSVFLDWWLVPWILVLVIYPLMLVVFHGDAIELERHSSQIAVQFRLAAWMFSLALLEVIAVRRRPVSGLPVHG